MKSNFTVRFYDADIDVQYQATFKKFSQAENYLASISEEGYIE